MGREVTARRVAHYGRRASDLVTDAVQHAPFDPWQGRGDPRFVFSVDDQIFRCQIYLARPVEGEPDEILEDPEGRGPDLMRYTLADADAVLWVDGPYLCVLSTEGDASRLLTMAMQRAWGHT